MASLAYAENPSETVLTFLYISSQPPFRFSILNLTMSSESQENDVSNDILPERKYSQLFTHESNIFLLKQLSGK